MASNTPNHTSIMLTNKAYHTSNHAYHFIRDPSIHLIMAFPSIHLIMASKHIKLGNKKTR